MDKIFGYLVFFRQGLLDTNFCWVEHAEVNFLSSALLLESQGLFLDKVGNI